MNIIPFVVDGKNFHLEINLFVFEENGQRILIDTLYQSTENDHDAAVDTLQRALKHHTLEYLNGEDYTLEATITFRMKAENTKGYVWVVDRVSPQGYAREINSTIQNNP